MGRSDRIKKIAVLIAMLGWITTVLCYASTLRWTSELTTRPQLLASGSSNNLWLSGGRFAWSRFDASQLSTASSPVPSGVRFRTYSATRASWFWRPYIRTQPGGLYIGVPLWIPAIFLIPLGPLPLALHARQVLLRNRRMRSRCCFACGYDLNSLPTPFCPECGYTEAIP